MSIYEQFYHKPVPVTFNFPENKNILRTLHLIHFNNNILVMKAEIYYRYNLFKFPVILDFIFITALS